MQVDWQGPPLVLQRLTGGGWLGAIQWVDKVDSTNRLAKQIADGSAVETPLLVVSPNQTFGRGRLGRRWFSDAGTLTFSILLGQDDLQARRDRWPQLALVAGLAVADVARDLVVPAEVRVKWPNDVYIDGGKVAGILIESAGPSSELVVVGIGFNVQTNLSDADLDVRANARSLRDFLDQPIATLDVLPAIIERLQCRISAWNSEPEQIMSEFGSHCFLTGRDVVIDQSGHAVQGRCLGIDGHGQLLVRSGPDVCEVRSGEVVSWSE